MGRQQSLFPREVMSEQDIENLVSPLHQELFGIVNDPFARFFLIPAAAGGIKLHEAHEDLTQDDVASRGFRIVAKKQEEKPS